MRKIEIPKDTPTEFELGDTAAHIQRRRAEREQRERGGDRGTTEAGEGNEEARRLETTEPQTEEAVAEKKTRTERSESEMDTKGDLYVLLRTT